MDTTLLWTQGLTLLLSATALYVAAIRRSGRFQPIGNAILYVAILLGFAWLCCMGWAASYFLPSGGATFFFSLAFLFLLGGGALQFFGSRPEAPGLPARAMSWSWRWLLGIVVITGALESIAFHNYKLSAEQRIAVDLDKARAFAQLYNPPVPSSLNAAALEYKAFDLLVRTTGEAAGIIDQIRSPASLDLAPFSKPSVAAALEQDRRALAVAELASKRASYFSLEESTEFPWEARGERAEKVVRLEMQSRPDEKIDLGRGNSRNRLFELLSVRAAERAASGQRSAAAEDLSTLWGLERFHFAVQLVSHATELALQAPGWTARELQSIDIPESAPITEQLNSTLAHVESEGTAYGILSSRSAISPGSLNFAAEHLLAKAAGDEIAGSSDPLDHLFGLILTLREEMDLQRSHQLLDQLWQIAYLPPAQRTAALHSQRTADSYDTRWTRDVMAGVLNREARRRVSRTAIAFLEHRAASGKDVSTLSELVPAELDAVPEDPYDGNPLRLAVTASGPVIYSIGPDGRDDHGKMLEGYENADGLGDVVFRLPKN